MTRLIKIFLEIIGWIQIAFGTTLIACLLAWPVYSMFDTNMGKTIAILVICIGFILGSIWATKILIKRGTINCLSQIRRIK
jgi:hypothetical protein